MEHTSIYFSWHMNMVWELSDVWIIQKTASPQLNKKKPSYFSPKASPNSPHLTTNNQRLNK